MPLTADPETTTRMELKYCEGCGALCLRSADNSSPYCTACRIRLDQHSGKQKAGRS